MSNQKNEPFGTPDADGRYKWKGDDMIRPAGRVQVMTRGSSVVHENEAIVFTWTSPSQIVKWRPAQ